MKTVKVTNLKNILYKILESDTILTVQKMGTRLMAGQQTLNLYVEVRLLCAQLIKTLNKRVFLFYYRKTPGYAGGAEKL